MQVDGAYRRDVDLFVAFYYALSVPFDQNLVDSIMKEIDNFFENQYIQRSLRREINDRGGINREDPDNWRLAAAIAIKQGLSEEETWEYYGIKEDKQQEVKDFVLKIKERDDGTLDFDSMYSQSIRIVGHVVLLDWMSKRSLN